MLKELILLGLLGYAMAACDYKIENLKYKAVTNTKDLIVENVSASFDDKCGLKIQGCAKINKPWTKIVVKYKGKKNGMVLVDSKKEACGFKYEDLEVKCPIKSPATYCAKPGWTAVEIPKAALSLAVGKITGEVNVVVNDKDTIKFTGEAEIKKK